MANIQQQKELTKQKPWNISIKLTYWCISFTLWMSDELMRMTMCTKLLAITYRHGRGIWAIAGRSLTVSSRSSVRNGGLPKN